ncbi:hypothetical protein A1F99_095020 [Pyrenophora tritici-repentis]|nr:hypothetical protein A1F99_095020 [Pyrenophora tritici-repentis]
MESAAKRKAGGAAAATGDSDNRPAKRQKGTTDTNSKSETVASTTAAGMKFLDSLKQAKDKTYVPCWSLVWHWQLPAFLASNGSNWH